jgi:hypothetical protein
LGELDLKAFTALYAQRFEQERMMHTRMTMEELDAQLSAEFGGPAIGAWPRSKGERIKPHKGGGGGDGGAAEREKERQARIKAATEEINNIFNNKVKQTRTVYKDPNGNAISKDQYDLFSALPSGSDGLFNWDGLKPTATNEDYWVDGDPANAREKMYADQKTAVYDLNKAEVDRQATEAERNMGLLGGSVDVDSNAELDRRTNEGLMRAGGIADQSAADFRVADERTRSNLISMAQSGIDTGTAAQMALGGLKANSDSVAQARAGATVGSLFNDLSQAYLINQANAGRAAGVNQYGNQWYGVSSPTQTYQGAKA